MTSSDTGITVYFACPHCSAVYGAAQMQSAENCPGEFYCNACATPVHVWDGAYHFSQWHAAGNQPPRKREALARRRRGRSFSKFGQPANYG
jgi:hypothetical protein